MLNSGQEHHHHYMANQIPTPSMSPHCLCLWTHPISEGRNSTSCMIPPDLRLHRLISPNHLVNMKTRDRFDRRPPGSEIGVRCTPTPGPGLESTTARALHADTMDGFHPLNREPLHSLLFLTCRQIRAHNTHRPVALISQKLPEGLEILGPREPLRTL